MKFDGHTKLAFVLGYPVAHSLSPAMHQAAFAATGINAAYLPWSVAPDRLAESVQGLRAMENLLGANVTVPHKEAIVPLLDGLTPEGETLGAVNTVLPRAGKLVGDNTDGTGFLAALREDLGCETADITVVVLGAGGAARAVAVSLAQAGARRIVLANRSLDRARHLTTWVAARSPDCEVTAQALQPEWQVSEVPEIRLVVNTTSVGLHASDPALFDYASLSAQTMVFDLIYNPPETALLRWARSRGCRVANGMGMLVHQGALAFEQWTGNPAPVHVMREAVGI